MMRVVAMHRSDGYLLVLDSLGTVRVWELDKLIREVFMNNYQGGCNFMSQFNQSLNVSNINKSSCFTNSHIVVVAAKYIHFYCMKSYLMEQQIQQDYKVAISQCSIGDPNNILINNSQIVSFDKQQIQIYNISSQHVSTIQVSMFSEDQICRLVINCEYYIVSTKQQYMILISWNQQSSQQHILHKKNVKQFQQVLDSQLITNKKYLLICHENYISQWHVKSQTMNQLNIVEHNITAINRNRDNTDDYPLYLGDDNGNVNILHQHQQHPQLYCQTSQQYIYSIIKYKLSNRDFIIVQGNTPFIDVILNGDNVFRLTLIS